MEKVEGDFLTVDSYKEGLALFRKLIASTSGVKKFYLGLLEGNALNNVTFRTSTALGPGVEGETQMYVQKSAKDNDVDVDTFDFTGVTNKTPRTLRLTQAAFKTNRYSATQVAATLVHEFLVHGVPFESLFRAIASSTDPDEMATFWRKSRDTDNSGYRQHSLYGARKTVGLDEILAALKDGKAAGISKKDAGQILDELNKDIASHKERYPLKS